MSKTTKQYTFDCTLNSRMGILYPIFKLHVAFNDYSARTPEWSGL